MKRFSLFLLFAFLYFFGYSQCSGFKIVADDSSMCAPAMVRYNVLNPVAGSSYEWNVGNGNVAGSDTIYSFYATSKVVDVLLKITLSSGVVCNVTEPKFVEVHSAVVPEVKISRTLLCNGPDTVSLTDVSPGSAKRSWIVDGTNYSNASKAINHKFVSAGSKSISIVLVDNNGCQSVREYNMAVVIYKDPAFDFAADVTNGCAPQSPRFTISNNPDLSPFTKEFKWSFETLASHSDKTGASVLRQYPKAGKYNVGLQIKVSNGCTYNIQKPEYINMGDTVPLIISPRSISVCTGAIVNLEQTNNSVPGDLTWTFSGVETTILSQKKNKVSLKCSKTGYLNVNLSHDHNGCFTSKQFNDSIFIKTVEADFSSNDNFHCLVPHTVHLDNKSLKYDASNLIYKWRVLKGKSVKYTSSDKEPQFTFNKMPASYSVELIVSGDNGCSDTMTKLNYIYQDSMHVDFSLADYKVCLGQDLEVINETKPSTYAVTDSFKWYFFNSNDVDILDSSKLRIPSTSYNKVGYYDILIIGYNDLGCTDTLLRQDIVEVIDPILDYSISDSIICVGSTLSLVGKSTPIRANFTHKWWFESLETGSIDSLEGASSVFLPKTLGEYKSIYEHSIGKGCKVRDTATVHVNGVEASMSLDTTYGCAPFEVKPSIEILEDFYEGQSASSYTYEWSASSTAGVSIVNSGSSTPTFSFSSNGVFKIKLKITNASGCSYFITSEKISVGVRAKFKLLDNVICLGDTFIIEDQSYNGVTHQDWLLNTTNPHTFTYESGNQYRLIVDKPGNYKISQAVTNQNICFDTASFDVKVIEVIAEFSAVDSFLNCAPVFAEFISTSQSADSLFWDFGTDEVFKTTKSTAGIIYSKNSGWSRGYDIQLVAKSVEGCSDTVVRNDYLVVAGPVPLFEMENNEGCEPLEVKFIDKSIDAKYFYFNYNDGSVLDSTKVGDVIGIRPYSVTLPNLLRQAVSTSIIAYDSLGCASIYEPVDSVIIYRTPTIKRTFTHGLKNCNPFNLTFENKGKFVDKREWSLNGSILSGKGKDSVMLTSEGNHQLSLVVSNSNNCTDTADADVVVYDIPKLDFEIDDTICINQMAKFIGKIAGKSSIDFFQWNFDEKLDPNSINTTDISASFTYKTTGYKDIVLKAGSDKGCIDSVIHSVLITDESYIDNPAIKYVSFVDNQTLEVVYENSTYAKFNRYVLQNSGGEVEVDDRLITRVEINIPSMRPMSDCYTLRVIDDCELKGAKSAAHCYMELTTSSANPYENKLNWTPYRGWVGVKEYNVYREDEHGVFMLLASVDGLTTEYLDLGLCDKVYNYYVEAKHATEEWGSNSCMERQRPIYTNNLSMSSINNVSVTGVDEISIAWDSSVFSEFEKYKLYKYNTTLDNLVSIIEVTEASFVDLDVSTDKFSYIYKVVEEDRCGYVNMADREGKSVLLDGYYDDFSVLSWTRYENWKNGVQKYNVEIKVDESFEFLQNATQDTSLTDEENHLDISGEYCYRVYAINNEGDTSYSNVVCVNGDIAIYIPTAFSPNSDGLNENFNPITQFVEGGIVDGLENYSLEIFSRWGEKIFKTNDLKEGWSGNVKAKKCQQGVYVYKLLATDLYGRRIYKNGTVTLLR